MNKLNWILSFALRLWHITRESVIRLQKADGRRGRKVWPKMYVRELYCDQRNQSCVVDFDRFLSVNIGLKWVQVTFLRSALVGAVRFKPNSPEEVHANFFPKSMWIFCTRNRYKATSTMAVTVATLSKNYFDEKLRQQFRQWRRNIHAKWRYFFREWQPLNESQSMCAVCTQSLISLSRINSK